MSDRSSLRVDFTGGYEYTHTHTYTQTCTEGHIVFWEGSKGVFRPMLVLVVGQGVGQNGIHGRTFVPSGTSACDPLTFLFTGWREYSLSPDPGSRAHMCCLNVYTYLIVSSYIHMLDNGGDGGRYTTLVRTHG